MYACEGGYSIDAHKVVIIKPIKYMINVKVLPSGIDFLTVLLVGIILVLTFGGYIYLYRKNSK